MKVFYDSADNNQVQAFYTCDTNSTAWAAFNEITVDDPTRQAEILQYGRDCRLTIVDSVVTAVVPYDHPTDHSLDNHKATKCAAIDAKSQELIAAGFEYSGKTFSLSANAQMKVLGLRTAVLAGALVEPDGYPIPYACMDETTYIIAAEADVVGLFNAGFVRMQTVLVGGATLKGACMAAADQAALDAIVDTRE